ncbi:hypothetical protein [Methanosarcina mazei]|nr:hypothetical protein [Methanosarcina mazei]
MFILLAVLLAMAKYAAIAAGVIAVLALIYKLIQSRRSERPDTEKRM